MLKRNFFHEYFMNAVIATLCLLIFFVAWHHKLIYVYRVFFQDAEEGGGLQEINKMSITEFCDVLVTKNNTKL